MTNMSDRALRQKIYTALATFPIITPSQLQIVLGTNVRAVIWRPVLSDMIAQGIVAETQIQVNEHTPSPEDPDEAMLVKTTFHRVLYLAGREVRDMKKPLEVLWNE